MTREMVIADLKRCIEQRDNYLNVVSVPNIDAMKKAVELLEQYSEKLANDIPITIWDISYERGGPPPWAIARAYCENATVWCRDKDDIMFYTNYTIERRPE